MAKVRDNPILDGLSGKLGKRIVIRKGRGGKTIVALLSADPGEREYSEAELAQQAAFKQAAIYAKTAKDQPIYVQRAKGEEATAFNFAVADWLGQPEVLNIDAAGWSGASGKTIRIQAQDDTKVTNVRVVIHNNGTILEEGDAVPSETDGLLWIYTTTTDITPAPGILLDANAYDLPGNFGTSSVSLN